LKEKVSISLSAEVLERVDQAAKEENRKRSNYIDTVLRKHFKLEEARQKPYAKLI
jgi:metal-responsive CopG/Arc/MetJ family transcriptional regulator